MAKRTMIIGLPPDYRYPGTLAEWDASNTLYAANLGACLICNSLLRQFDADYIDNFDNIQELQQNYDVCILALATHLHPNRDVSLFVDAVEKLQIKTIVLSAGISDYYTDVSHDYHVHPSMVRLLRIATERSKWIGVRGHYSAALLHREGFTNVVPIGCPSLYWGLTDELAIRKNAAFERPVVPYHLTMAQAAPRLLDGVTFLGQDFQDQGVFTDELKQDDRLQGWLRDQFGGDEEFLEMRTRVRKHGTFVSSFSEWFELIARHDFVVGPRLHGCIAGVIQRIPTVMTPRDLRGREIAEFFGLPTGTYEDLASGDLQGLYERADFTCFNEVFPRRYQCYVDFLNENGVTHKLGAANGRAGHLSFDDWAEYVKAARIIAAEPESGDAPSNKEQMSRAGDRSSSIKRLFARLRPKQR